MWGQSCGQNWSNITSRNSMRPDAILTTQVLLMQLLQQILAAESTALVNRSWAQTTCVLIVCCLLGDILFFRRPRWNIYSRRTCLHLSTENCWIAVGCAVAALQEKNYIYIYKKKYDLVISVGCWWCYWWSRGTWGHKTWRGGMTFLAQRHHHDLIPWPENILPGYRFLEGHHVLTCIIYIYIYCAFIYLIYIPLSLYLSLSAIREMHIHARIYI